MPKENRSLVTPSVVVLLSSCHIHRQADICISLAMLHCRVFAATTQNSSNFNFATRHKNKLLPPKYSNYSNNNNKSSILSVNHKSQTLKVGGAKANSYLLFFPLQIIRIPWGVTLLETNQGRRERTE